MITRHDSHDRNPSIKRRTGASRSRRIRPVALAGLMITLAMAGLPSCGTGANSTARRSVLCAGLTGFEALAWDYYNGILVTDPNLPPPPPVGGVFGHPDFPLLGFSYNPNWTPFIVRDAATQGVNLIRNDNQAIWRLVYTVVTGTPNVREVRDNEIRQILDFYGFNGSVQDVQTICLNEASSELSPGSGIVGNVSNIMIQTPGHTAIIGAQVTPFAGGLNSSSIAVRAMAAPTNEFAQRAFDSFMAIDWQFLIGEARNIDSDGDGWLDQFDAEPNNPAVH